VYSIMEYCISNFVIVLSLHPDNILIHSKMGEIRVYIFLVYSKNQQQNTVCRTHKAFFPVAQMFVPMFFHSCQELTACVQRLSTLNLFNITSKFRTVPMFATVEVQTNSISYIICMYVRLTIRTVLNGTVPFFSYFPAVPSF
jgi:hypothetical protein